jgi:excisionase family DNA binding protein
VTAATVVPGQQQRAAIAAQVQRVDAIQITPALANLIHRFLSRYADLATQRYGAPPEGLQDTQYALGEALASKPDYSRQREQNPADSPQFIGLGGDEVMSTDEAAKMLDLKADSVRYMCREGKLAAKRPGRQWFPLLAAVQELKAAREDR